MHVLGELGSINGEKQILSQDEHWGPLLHHHSFHGSHGWTGMASSCMTFSLQGNENDHLTIGRIIICYTVTKTVLKMFIISLY